LYVVIVGLISEAELGAQSIVYEVATIAYMVGLQRPFGLETKTKLYICSGLRIFSDPAAPAVCRSTAQDINITFIQKIN